MSDEKVPTTAEVREEVAWAGTGPWTELTDEVNANIEARGQAFDRWLDRALREAKAEALEEASSEILGSRVTDPRWLFVRAKAIREGGDSE